MDTTVARLSRAGLRPAAPIRIVHLGLGSFFRAHQAWYTDRAADASEWGIAAFSGRTRRIADLLTEQDGVYFLITRDATDAFEFMTSVSRVHGADEYRAWREYLASDRVSIVTMTVTEAGYCRGADGHLDTGDPAVAADIAALRKHPGLPVSTAVARLVAGLDARRAAGGPPLAVVPCDNLPDNGSVIARMAREFADLALPGLGDWIDANVSFVTSMVDRITPATTTDDIRAAELATGFHDAAPVLTEPFREWVLCGDFPSGRPRWEDAGATFTSDITPYEQRKLWLLNGAHSLLAYTAPLRGHHTVGEAIGDPVCRAWVEQWWDEAAPHIHLPNAIVSDYRAALLARFANPRMRHQLSQIAMDGSQKLPVRILPVLARERPAGRMPGGAVRILAGWVCHLMGEGVPVSDPRAVGIRGVDAALECLDPALAADRQLVDAVASEVGRLRAPR